MTSVILPATVYYPFPGIIAIYPTRIIDADALRYVSLDPTLRFIDNRPQTGMAVAYVGRKGRYRIQVIPLKAGVPGLTAETLVIIGGPKPIPGPAYVWAVMIDNPTNTVLSQGKILGDLTYWQAKQSQGHKFRILGVRDSMYVGHGYDRLLRNYGLSVPAIVLLDPVGKVLSVRSLPATTAEIDTLIAKAITGV